MLGKQYTDEVLSLARRVIDTQSRQIGAAADRIFTSLREDGLLHVFGCGHSHILAEECFYRAGGLVPINPIFESSAMLHEGAVKSSLVERMPGFARLILDNYATRPGECLIIFSTSGINPVPVEMAVAARERGLTVIALTSGCYGDVRPRSENGRLHDVADLVIDTQIPKGDALLRIREDISAVPGSTVIGCIVLNALIAEILERYQRAGLTPPVFVSGNTEGGFEKNRRYIEAYRGRVKSL